jgi:REP element-mobilizing transposase RayT
MLDPITYFITWTTYGTWLPGDARGWRAWRRGPQEPSPHLNIWCRLQMSESAIVLTDSQRRSVEAGCLQHALVRQWVLHTVQARSNHVHLVVTADKPPKTVRDQFKANATRAIRESASPITQSHVWTRGGDCDVVDGDEELERVLQYVNEAQDRMDRGK